VKKRRNGDRSRIGRQSQILSLKKQSKYLPTAHNTVQEIAKEDVAPENRHKIAAPFDKQGSYRLNRAKNARAQ
jgi:hypothetical protein